MSSAISICARLRSARGETKKASIKNVAKTHIDMIKHLFGLTNQISYSKMDHNFSGL